MFSRIYLTSIAILSLPLVLLGCLLWGTILGLAGNMVGTYQDWSKLVIEAYKKWKLKSKGYNEEGVLIGDFIIYNFYYLIIFPFRLILGIFLGPFYLTTDAFDFWETRFLKSDLSLATKELVAKDDLF